MKIQKLFEKNAKVKRKLSWAIVFTIKKQELFEKNAKVKRKLSGAIVFTLKLLSVVRKFSDKTISK